MLTSTWHFILTLRLRRTFWPQSQRSPSGTTMKLSTRARAAIDTRLAIHPPEPRTQWMSTLSLSENFASNTSSESNSSREDWSSEITIIIPYEPFDSWTLAAANNFSHPHLASSSKTTVSSAASESSTTGASISTLTPSPPACPSSCSRSGASAASTSLASSGAGAGAAGGPSFRAVVVLLVLLSELVGAVVGCTMLLRLLGVESCFGRCHRRFGRKSKRAGASHGPCMLGGRLVLEVCYTD